MEFLDKLLDFLKSTGFYGLFGDFLGGGWKSLVMIALSCFLLWLAIKKKFEPLLLIGIAFGMLLTNLPGANMYHGELWTQFMAHEIGYGEIMLKGGLLDYLYIGVKTCIYPCLIFIGIGAMTDFGPLISNPKSLILGAAAQIGIFIAFIGALLLGFNFYEAAAIGIIGGADGPTAILVSNGMLNNGGDKGLLAPIALAAYSYMALVPVIFPPLIKLFTTKKERSIKMEQLREVSKTEKILFPIIVTIVVCLIVPSATPLIGCLMLGNLIKECGVVPNLVNTLANSLLYICTIMLGTAVGATAIGTTFLQLGTLKVFALGISAFIFAAFSGLMFGKLMCVLTKGKVNPMIGAAGVSAVPMAARVVQKVGQKEDPSNFLLMHAMGPNVAGVIGSAVAAGILMSVFIPVL